MSAVTLSAHFDGQNLVLDEPFDFPKNVPLQIVVLAPENDGLDSEREDWARLGMESFVGAYGDNEPQYSLEDLKADE